MIKRINESKKTFVGMLILLFLLMFLLNHLTLMMVDDYRYSFSFPDAKVRITSVGQIIPSMRAHYDTMNGRLLMHGIVQLILLWMPGTGFDLLNAIAYVLLSLLLYDYGWYMHRHKHNALVFLAFSAAVWAFVPAYGEVFLWLDGSVNYLWSCVLILLYIRPAVHGTLTEMPLPGLIAYILAGVLAGAVSETLSMAAMGTFFLVFAAKKFIFHKKRSFLYLLPICAMLPTYLLMISSPGTHKNKLAANYAGQFVTSFRQYWYYLEWPLLIWCLLFICALYLRRNRNTLLYALLWMVLSVGMSTMHTFTVGYPARSMIGPAVFLILSDIVLFAAVWGSRYEITAACIGALAMCYALFCFIPGSYDIYSIYRQMCINIDTIQTEKAAGNMDITLKMVHPSTRYCAAYQLKYLDLEHPKIWPNCYMAMYYGVDMIRGTEG